METTERSVRTWMVSGRDSEVEETVAEIITGKTTILNVVKALGDYLTSEDGALRTKGVEFLSLVLVRCSPEKLTRQSVRVLVIFYCDKLGDTETVIPALKGLGSLVFQPSCTSGEVGIILRAVFLHVKMKALAASARFLVFSIIDTLMALQRDALKGMGNEFLSGYINLAEGEKDPRNLLTAFAIDRVLLIEFRIDEHVEALFNITFCYFPITFKQPLDDPYGVTTDMLKLALLSCLNATPAFGQLAIPIFVEKLTAGYPATKRDTLQAISSCLPVYGANLARASAHKLWSALKLEIFHPVDPLSEGEALITLRDLVKTIYSESNGENDDVQGFAQETSAECIQILREPEKSQAKSAIKILCALISTTSVISRYIISQTVPHLVKLFLDPDEVNNRSPILMLMSDLIIAARDFMLQSLTESDSPVLLFKDEVLGIITVGLKIPSSRRAALDGLKGMVTTKALLTDEELGFIVHNINGIIQTDSEDLDSSDAALELLSTVSASTPRHVREQTIPQLFNSLPDEAPAREDYLGRARYWRVLLALSNICVQPELFETLVIRLMTKLDLLCAPSAQPMHKGIDIEPSAAYAHSIMATLAKTLTTKVNKKHTDVPKYINSLVPRLFNLFLYAALHPGSDYMAATDRRLVNLAAQIITLVVQTLSLKTQVKFATALFSAFLQGDITGIAEGQQKVPLDAKFLPFDTSTSIQQKNLVAMFAAGIVAFRHDLPIPVSKPDEFLDMILIWSLSHSENVIQRDAVWHIAASIVNKRPDDVSSFLSNQLEWHWSREIKKGRSLERRQHAIRSWAWTSKALLLRGHASSMLFANRFFELFSDEGIDWYAAKAFGDICSSDVILTKSHHAVIKPLYAQKFVNATLPRLITGAKIATKSQQDTPHLVALTSLIQSIPKSTFTHEMPQLMPLLLRAVELPDNDIRANVISTLSAAFEGGLQGLNFISEHASTLVSIMLRNSLAQAMSSTRVRIAALRYLGILPTQVRYDTLHPYKSMAIRELAKALDDPKRSVRKEAVDARTNWIKYNG